MPRAAPSELPTLRLPTEDDPAWDISARSCEDFITTPSPTPTNAAPGTPEKLEVFAWRAENNHDLFHPLDKWSRVAPFSEVLQAMLEDRKDVQREVVYSPPNFANSANGGIPVQEGYVDRSFQEIDELDEQDVNARRQQLKEKLIEKRQASPTPALLEESKTEKASQPSQQRKKPGPRPGPKRKRPTKLQQPVEPANKNVSGKPSWRQKRAESFAAFVETVGKFGGIRAVRAKLDELEAMLR